jgi:hypothetical protein
MLTRITLGVSLVAHPCVVSLSVYFCGGGGSGLQPNLGCGRRGGRVVGPCGMKAFGLFNILWISVCWLMCNNVEDCSCLAASRKSCSRLGSITMGSGCYCLYDALSFYFIVPVVAGVVCGVFVVFAFPLPFQPLVIPLMSTGFNFLPLYRSYTYYQCPRRCCLTRNTCVVSSVSISNRCFQQSRCLHVASMIMSCLATLAPIAYTLDT